MVIVITAAVAATVVWFGLRRNLPPAVAVELAAYVLAVRSTLVDIVDEDAVTMLAGAIYDAWGDGSKYLSRDDFIAYVLKALRMEPDAVAVARTARIG